MFKELWDKFKLFIEKVMDPESHAELWDIIGPI